MYSWQPNPHHHDADESDDLLIVDGQTVGRVEDFGYVCYPMSLNAVTGNWERGGPYTDRVAAMQWAERVAGLHPIKPGDERPAFYYRP